jgi:hypothetical protein
MIRSKVYEKSNKTSIKSNSKISIKTQIELSSTRCSVGSEPLENCLGRLSDTIVHPLSVTLENKRKLPSNFTSVGIFNKDQAGLPVLNSPPKSNQVVYQPDSYYKCRPIIYGPFSSSFSFTSKPIQSGVTILPIEQNPVCSPQSCGQVLFPPAHSDSSFSHGIQVNAEIQATEGQQQKLFPTNLECFEPYEPFVNPKKQKLITSQVEDAMIKSQLKLMHQNIKLAKENSYLREKTEADSILIEILREQQKNLISHMENLILKKKID